MNLGQALISIGHGCYEWRQDISPGFSVLAFEAKHDPVEARTYILSVTYGKKKLGAERGLNALGEKMVRILHAAFEQSMKLSFAELCTQAGVSSTASYARDTLAFLYKNGKVQRTGKRRGTVYWAEEDL